MEVTRSEAIELGITKYDGKPCITCGTTLKWTAQSKCVKCEETYKSTHKAQQRDYQNSPMRKQARRNHELKQKYGLSIAEYEKMLETQNGTCATCDYQPIGKKKLGVDHNHQTGQIRGLLCDSCNLLIGRFGDDISKLKNAIVYLEDDREPRTVPHAVNRTIKQVLIVRTDLNMRKGKMIAQAAHAAIMHLRKNVLEKIPLTETQKTWMTEGMTKIGLQVGSEEQLLDLYNAAKVADLTVHLITDAGLTEFNGVPTKTCLAIGPNRAEDIDKITGALKLL